MTTDMMDGRDMFAEFWSDGGGNAMPARKSGSAAAALARLGKSRFRSSFRLDESDREYVRSKGMETIRAHAAEIIARRLAPAVIPNDGRQTPMRHGVHPVFLAQHATACCCRGCFEKWHGISKGRQLTPEEQDFAVGLIMEWINRQMQ